MARVTPTPDEMEIWRMATQSLPYASDRVYGGLVEAAEVRLCNRLARTQKLMALDAPEVIIQRSLGMVAEAVGMVLGVDDPETFALPSNATTKI